MSFDWKSLRSFFLLALGSSLFFDALFMGIGAPVQPIPLPARFTVQTAGFIGLGWVLELMVSYQRLSSQLTHISSPFHASVNNTLAALMLLFVFQLWRSRRR